MKRNRTFRSGATVDLCIIGVFVMGFLEAPPALPSVTHGPLVGAVTPESARFLVRTDSTACIEFEVDTDTSFLNPTHSSMVVAVPDSDFFVIVDVNGLVPDTKYFYRALLDGQPQSDVGHFVTFPSPGVAREFAFAWGSGQQNGQDPNSYVGRTWPLLLDDGLSFFLQIGDWTYPDTTDTPADSANFFSTLYSRVQAAYRSRYDPAYPMAELFKVYPIEYVHDDHDYTNNNSDKDHLGRENSIRGYTAMFPHYPLANKGNGIWHKFTFGNSDFFMLDPRSQRDPDINAFGTDATGKIFFRPTTDHLMLQADPGISGELQMDWLIRELQESRATWKFVVTTIPFNPGHRAAVELAVLLQGIIPGVPIPDAGFMTPAEIAVELADSWCGFPTSVARLVKAVSEAGVENVLMLSADSHTAAIDDGAHSLFPEFMAGGLDRTNGRIVAMMQDFFINAWNRGGQTKERDNFNSHYGRVTVFGNDSVRCDLIDEYDELIASYTQLPGHLVNPLSLTLAPEGQAFDTVMVGDADLLPIIFINTGADTVQVTDISITDPAFSVSPFQKKFSLPPGLKTTVAIFFRPQEARPYEAAMTIESDDPESDDPESDDPESPFVVPLVGLGLSTSAVAGKRGAVPLRFKLGSNHPNPMKHATRIPFQIARDSDVTIRICNLAGQEVRNFAFPRQQAGHHSVEWDARNFTGKRAASGLYVYIMMAEPLNGGKRVVQSKMMMVVH